MEWTIAKRNAIRGYYPNYDGLDFQEDGTVLGRKNHDDAWVILHTPVTALRYLRSLGLAGLEREGGEVSDSGKTIYIVTSGEYSAYSIDGVFSTREKADTFATQWVENAEVEEWELDEFATHVRRTMYCTRISLESGEIDSRWILYYVLDPSECCIDGIPGSVRYIARSYESQEHADKLAVEYRQAWLREKSLVS